MNDKLRKALKAQIEARAAYNALPGDAEESRINELRRAAADADAAVVAALSEPATPAPLELRERVSVGRYLGAVANGQVLSDGAEAELRKELRMSDETIPIEAFAPRRSEHRADAISPQDADGNAIDSGEINTDTFPILRRVFEQTDIAWLGAAMPMVAAGAQRFPVLVGGTTGAYKERNTAIDAGAAKFDVVDAKPRRVSARYVWSLHDQMEFGQELEAVLRADVREAIGHAMDTACLTGDGSDGAISGFLQQVPITFPAGFGATTKDTGQADWAKLKALVIGYLDGKYARSEQDLRILVGHELYTQARALYRSATGDSEIDALMEMRRLGAGVRLSYQIPDPALVPANTFSTTIAKSAKKHERLAIIGDNTALIAPVWSGVQAIRDPYSDAASANVSLTLHAFHDFIIRRKDALYAPAVQTES